MLNTIIVEDEQATLRILESLLRTRPEVRVKGCFTRPEDALAFAAENEVSFALMDVEMPGMNGIELGAALRRLHPRMILIYISAHERYVMEALRRKADYYLTKPFSRADIDEVVERAKLLAARQEKRVFLRAFGTFDVFVEGDLLAFSNKKAKELLALCVNARGSALLIDDAVLTLWGLCDKQTKTLYRKAVLFLDSLFNRVQAEGVFRHARGSCWIEASLVKCDYFDYCNGEKSLFTGEYMSQYEWGEETLADMTEWNEN